jgi:hypothetical protein
MKAYWGSGGIAPRILNLALGGGKWSALRPNRFTARERAPSTNWIGGVGVGGLQSRSGPGGEEKNSQTGTPDHSARSPVLYHWAILATKYIGCNIHLINFCSKRFLHGV